MEQLGSSANSDTWLLYRQCFKKKRHHFADKDPYGQSYGFSSSHVWMWELDHKEGWMPKNWCFWTVVLEKTLERLLDCKEIQPVHPKGNQSWIFTGRTDAEAETPILLPSWWEEVTNEKTLMLGKIEGRRRRGLLLGIFSTQESNSCLFDLLHWQLGSLP